MKLLLFAFFAFFFLSNCRQDMDKKSRIYANDKGDS
jgi:hypothetical protein